MNTELVISDDKSTSIERVIATGDLSKLTPAERVRYYREICNSIGLNPLSQPFSYIVLSGKLTLYARKDATDQLRRIHGISITDLTSETINDVYCVTAHAMTRDGRTDQDTGAVYIGKLQGEALANAIMKARTKAKRRVTLSIAGLGWLDETDVDSLPGAQPVVVADTGEIVSTSDADAPESNGNDRQVQHASQPQLNRLHALGTQLYGAEWDAKRHLMAEKVSKGATKSSKELTPAEVDKLIAGMEKKIAESSADDTPTFHDASGNPFEAVGK